MMVVSMRRQNVVGSDYSESFLYQVEEVLVEKLRVHKEIPVVSIYSVCYPVWDILLNLPELHFSSLILARTVRWELFQASFAFLIL